MPTAAFQAHFDGEHIILDEEFDLPVNARLVMTVLPAPAEPESESDWLQAAATNDAFAFLANPEEDIYSPEDGEAFEHAV